jgi:hypothetical protein
MSGEAFLTREQVLEVESLEPEIAPAVPIPVVWRELGTKEDRRKAYYAKLLLKYNNPSPFIRRLRAGGWEQPRHRNLKTQLARRPIGKPQFIEPSPWLGDEGFTLERPRLKGSI